MSLARVKARVFIERVIDMSESEITPDNLTSTTQNQTLLLVEREHALPTVPGDAASAAVVSLPAATDRGAHVRLCLCFDWDGEVRFVCVAEMSSCLRAQNDKCSYFRNVLEKNVYGI